MRQAFMKIQVTALVGLSGCFVHGASSREVLGPDASSALVAAPPLEAAREISRLMSTRGFHLVDQHASPGGLTLRFTGGRRSVVTGANHTTSTTEFASMFDAEVQGTDPQTSAVSLIGRPLADGSVVCTPSFPGPCVAVADSFSEVVSGQTEAQVVHGVFAELALEGKLASGPKPVPVLAPAIDPVASACLARRKAAFDHALAANDVDERDRELAQLPRCPAPRT
jgi:hypothetical protein